MNKASVLIAAALMLLCCNLLANEAQRVNSITGSIQTISSDSFSVQSETGVLEFNRSKQNRKLPEGTEVGDVVKIWFRADAIKIKVYKNIERQGSDPSQKKPSQPLPLNIDDRAFYPA